MLVIDIFFISFCFSLLIFLLKNKFMKNEKPEDLFKKMFKYYQTMLTKALSQDEESLSTLKDLYYSILKLYVKEVVYIFVPFLFGMFLVIYYLPHQPIYLYPGLVVQKIKPEMFYILCSIGFISIFESLFGDINEIMKKGGEYAKTRTKNVE